MARYKHAILNTSRWETETITEWLCYYRSIGFDHAYIYCNDDDPSELYEKLLPFIQLPNPFVTFHHLPYQGQQDHMYVHFLNNYKEETEWFMFVDADEFLAIKTHPGIKEFMLERESKYDCIYFNWIWFGPQDFWERPGGSTLRQFTRREDHEFQMNYFTKTLTRSSMVDPSVFKNPPPQMLNHNWPEPIFSKLRTANVLGDSMVRYFENFPESGAEYLADANVRRAIVDTAVTYHYLFRSRRDFVRRVERGTLGAYYFQPTWKNLHDGGDLETFVATLHAREDRFLADYWDNYVTGHAQASTLIPTPRGVNLALTSTPTQSSRSPWSKGDIGEDARGAISGVHTGQDGFHTDLEDNPWWMTDLGEVKRVREVRVFNSMKNPEFAARAFPLLIELSQDGAEWRTLYRNEARKPFGGVDGRPLALHCGWDARYVRLSLLTRDFFHLDQVEIYGD